MLADMLYSSSLALCQMLDTRRTSYLVATLWIIWQLIKLLKMYSKRPLNTHIGGTSILLFGKWFTSLEFVVDGAGTVFSLYQRLGRDKSFAIPALNEYQVLVSSEQKVRELGESAESVLSFHTAMEQRIQHKYTLFGFQHNDIDPHNDIAKRVIKVLLRINLPQMQQGLQPLVQDLFKQELTDRDSDGWSQASGFTLAKHLVTRINNYVLLGEKLASDPAFEDAVNRYLQDVVVTMELCRHLPSFLVPLVAPAMMRWSGAMHFIGRSVTAEVEDRLVKSNGTSQDSSKPCDGIQWVIDSSKTPEQRTVSRLAQQIIAILFASVHQMAAALVYAMYDLCLHPEFIEPLREEIKHARSATSYEDHFDRLPLMDSFLRESARLSPLDAYGTHVPTGNLVAVPQEAIMQDPEHYPDPKKFDPYRFLAVDEADGHDDSPGRWFVSRTLKQVLSHVIMEYDVKLADENASRTFVWTTAIVPRSSTKLMLRARN
ncbi:cytochrome P450 [Aspergillus luchuensis]|uniref:Cytochrome P450 n=1 Tax=Aspergillus kawachii TaxID=1069201 RepID=A0A146F0Z9_ASPKA|nr:cytochrome P450 [Aspergillus luchuensis]